jgi:hypothetical protein
MSMEDNEKRTFLREYTRALREGEAALFVGAGISREAGYVDWKNLLKDISEELGLDVDRESDLVALAQFHVNHRKGRDRINQLLIDEFLENVQLTQSHHVIASLPVHTVWTTNYDDLLETAFANANKRTDVKRKKEDFATSRRRTDVTIYKMHGDKTDPASAVLTKEDYETYDTSRELFTIALKGDLARKTFLFLGVSFSDPNLVYILSRVRQLLESNGRKHYCILKSPAPDSIGPYNSKRFHHWAGDLHRYNIQPILIQAYEEVPEILADLSRRAHLQDVFISGTAATCDPLGEQKFDELCRLLGAELIHKGFNIISGFGTGVGDRIIFGAMHELPRNDDERIQMWPFPQNAPKGTDLPAFQRKYREGMISNSGACIVLSGNKLGAGGVVLAEGVRQEAEIARAQGKIVIPIGATGHVAQELWGAGRGKAELFGGADLTRNFEVLGDSSASAEALTKAVINILKQLERQ